MTNKIVSVHAYSSKTPWVQEIGDAIEAELKNAGHEIAWSKYYLSDENIKENIFNEILKIKPDLVILEHDESVDLLIEKLNKQKINTVFTSVVKKKLNFDWMKKEFKDYQSGILINIDILPAFSVLKKFYPNIKSISLVGGGCEISKYHIEIMTEQIKKENPNLHIEAGNFAIADEWKQAILNANKNSDAAIILTPYEIYNHFGVKFSINDGLNFSKEHLKIPAIGKSKLISFCTIAEALGKSTASIVQFFLENGALPKKVVYKEFSSTEISLDQREIKRLKINLSDDLKSLVALN